MNRRHDGRAARFDRSRACGWHGVLIILGLIATACTSGTQPIEPPAETGRDDAAVMGGVYQRLRVVLPDGDPDAGREAFLDLQCTVCHEVAGDEELAEPYGSAQGPRLSGELAGRSPEYLATAMIAPSHSISREISDELRSRLEWDLSPMADYSHVMTVRQLADLLAYLQSIDG